MQFETLSYFKETWGLIFLFLLLIGAFFYAVLPSNKEKFDEAAQMPLNEKEEDHG